MQRAFSAPCAGSPPTCQRRRHTFRLQPARSVLAWPPTAACFPLCCCSLLGSMDTGGLNNYMAAISRDGRFVAAGTFTSDVKVGRRHRGWGVCTAASGYRGGAGSAIARTAHHGFCEQWC